MAINCFTRRITIIAPKQKESASSKIGHFLLHNLHKTPKATWENCNQRFNFLGQVFFCSTTVKCHVFRPVISKNIYFAKLIDNIFGEKYFV